MASSLGSGNRHAGHFSKSEIEVSSLEAFQKILDSTELDLSEFSDNMAYSGFDRNKVAKLAAARLGGYRTVKFCLLGGMRGSNLKKICDKSTKVDSDILECYRAGKIVSNGTGPEDLTMGRLMATFPEITAHYMSKNGVSKKLIECQCPAALQFPAAAGLPMSHTIRLLHLEFAIRFSFLISGDKKFHPQYYKAALSGQLPSARLSPELKPICGDPVDEESRSFDYDAAMSAMVEKYGKERFVFEGGVAPVPVSSSKKTVL